MTAVNTPMRPADREKNRFSARARRYAKVGTQLGGTAARFAGARFFGVPLNRAANALELAAALGGLKGPIMKVAQLLATIPDALPPEYANELIKLQSQAPPMGWAFVKRRMSAELGIGWQKKFSTFEHHPAAAASLGQVHRAHALDGSELACKLQYPDMQSAVEADLSQLQLLFAIRKRFDPAIDTRNRLATAMFTAWWFPFSRVGVIHGDPHLGNYTVFDDARGKPAGINLLDYGCIRIFPPIFVGGVVDLSRGLLHRDDNLVVHAYETWGFKRLNRDLIDALNIWARFIYGPLLDDRVRTIADGVKPSEYGRREAFRVHQALRQKGPVTVPR